ncbi:nitroreductase family protein [Entomomonas asaccharolytica]|uniref:Nitroreductase family protein n=1 Tax=Entomomonas asaccharolytica TaxID=2785331 RepID=A0A974NH72_9GAMM|nr:nitroreductase family protein [Entomomonas asaccharolytica]QQP86513.1 nitroreductase family protein [Entomomonas asaccharolytica]
MISPSIQVLPAPDKTGGKPLMQALAERKTIRDFNDKPITEQALSDLLWATWGMNREGWRTAPTSMNNQQIIVFVVKPDGIWRFNAAQHQLEKVLEQNYYAAFGGAPLTFIYTGSQGKYDALSIGALYQNAGLYCASIGLGNVIETNHNQVLGNRLPLPVGYKIYITQSFGWPK